MNDIFWESHICNYTFSFKITLIFTETLRIEALISLYLYLSTYLLSIYHLLAHTSNTFQVTHFIPVRKLIHRICMEESRILEEITLPL